MSNPNLKLDKVPSQRIKLEHVRLQTPVMWGPIGGDTLIKSGGKFMLELSELGVHIMLKGEATEALVPLANVKFAVIQKESK